MLCSNYNVGITTIDADGRQVQVLFVMYIMGQIWQDIFLEKQQLYIKW